MIVRAWIDDSGTLRCASQVCSSERDCPRWSGCKWYEVSFGDVGRQIDLENALGFAYRALTEGLADVPAEGREPRCARLRAEAKREIRRVLGIKDSGD